MIAEGVETEAAYNKLASLGCDLVQGFLVSRPMPQEQLLTWLDRCNAQPESMDLPRPVQTAPV